MPDFPEFPALDMQQQPSLESQVEELLIEQTNTKRIELAYRALVRDRNQQYARLLAAYNDLKAAYTATTAKAEESPPV